LHGVDPVRSHRASLLPESVVEGRFEEIAARPGARPGIALGAVLAQQLGVGLGDPVQVRVMVPELAFSEVPSLRGRSFEVVAVFRAGFEEFDAGWALIDRQVAQDLFRLEQPAERIAIRTASVDQVPAVSEALRRELGADYVVSDIYDQFEELFAALRLEKLLLFIAVGLIVLVAAFGVVSTLVLTVTQKIRSIGVLAAIGVAPSGLIRVFVYQGMAMGVLGTIGGAALGVVAAWLLDRLELIPLDPRVYLLDHLPFHLIWSDVAATVVMALLLSAGATLYPAWRVSRLDPVEALRHD
jgi:lipoprotein-releasing system permease protein